MVLFASDHALDRPFSFFTSFRNRQSNWPGVITEYSRAMELYFISSRDASFVCAMHTSAYAHSGSNFLSSHVGSDGADSYVYF